MCLGDVRPFGNEVTINRGLAPLARCSALPMMHTSPAVSGLIQKRLKDARRLSGPVTAFLPSPSEFQSRLAADCSSPVRSRNRHGVGPRTRSGSHRGRNPSPPGSGLWATSAICPTIRSSSSTDPSAPSMSERRSREHNTNSPQSDNNGACSSRERSDPPDSRVSDRRSHPDPE